jgi:phage tail-like protein
VLLMDPNGTRLHLVLGLPDWERVIVPPADPDVCFDEDRHTLGLRPRPFVFPTRSDAPRLGPDARRGADVDRHGNLFWIGTDRQSILVLGAGQSAAFVWWSTPAAEPIADDATFRVCDPIALDGVQLSGLAITGDQYLVAGVLDLPLRGTTGGGLLVFDLTGGGPPVPLAWSVELGVCPFDITALPDGGIIVLDVEDPLAPGPGRLWHLDRHLRLVAPVTPPRAQVVAPVFTPVDSTDEPVAEPSSAPVTRLEAASPNMATNLDAQWPIAVQATADGSVLVLDRLGPEGRLDVSRWRCGARQEFGIRVGVDEPAVGLICSDQRANINDLLDGVAGHDLTVILHADGDERLFLVDGRGDQAFEFTLEPAAADLITSYHPLRLFSGKALVGAGDTAFYDLADRWFPIPTRAVGRFATDAVVVLAPDVPGGRGFDAGAPGVVWHRLVLDAIIPPGTSVSVETRTADDPAVLERRPWLPEPAPYRRGDGSELAYHEYGSGGECAGQGTWELLLQRAAGRYVQVRLALRGDRSRTPRIWALRLHYPRFSYLAEYLPAIYREDRESGSFLDRYLANVEGMYTTLESRIVNVRRLVDPETIDTEFLPWLASWVGAVVEPDWEPARQRLLVRHAAQMFTRRGTQRGLVEAIQLATHPCPTDAIFEPGSTTGAFDVRIVESFRTRSTAGVAFGNPNDLQGPGFSTPGSTWRLEDGAAQLQERWRRFLSGRPTSTLAVGDPPSFPVRTPTTAAAIRDWHDFVRSELAVTYADVTNVDQETYQTFLAERYRRIDAYRAAWNLLASGGPDDFSEITLPTTLPADGPPLQDWIMFVSSVLPIRRAAHRAKVLVPIRFEDSDEQREQRLGRVRRVVDVERPAHTLVDVEPYWAACRVGSARVGLETIVGEGSRYLDLVIGTGRLAYAVIPGGSTWRIGRRTVVGRDRIQRSAAPAKTGG